MLTGTLAADAAAPDLDRLLADAPGWSVERWTVEDGLPVNAISQLLHTRDGYLWIATFDGLLCGLAVLALLGLGILARDRRQRRRQRELERLVAERTREVSEQARKLAEIDRAKSELYANISHEFRTPLTLALGPLRDLQEGLYGPLESAVIRQVKLVRANAARVLELINQLLDVAKIDSGGLRLAVIHDDLAEFVDLVSQRFVALAERRQVDYAVATPPEPVRVYFDPEQLDKVVTNLLANAFKFTPAGGAVAIGLTEEDDEVVLTVRDSGRGIPRESLPCIFQRFYQTQGSARRGRAGRPPGTGLGLALARELVELHDGRLEVASERGKGSTFTVRLRRGRHHFTDDQIVDQNLGGSTSTDTLAGILDERALAVEAALAELEDRKPDDGTAEVPDDRTTVLVVDDHPDLRAYVRRHLAERYRVVEARDGAEGLARARQLLPDLVISDVMMPLPESAPEGAPADGFELVRELKQDPELDWVPVVLLTAKATAEARLEGLGIGADDYLTKPFDVRELVARVDNLVASRRRLRDRLLAGGPGAVAQTAAGNKLPFPDLPAVTSDEKRFLARVAEAIDTGLSDEEFDVAALSRRVALSRTQLYVRLKELTGKPPSRLLLERRLERGAALLESGAGQVSEAAYAVGFKSVSQFSRHFRTRYGTTPSSFRHQHAG